MSSILNDTKVSLGVMSDDPSFDLTIMLGINAALSDLHDIGVGPVDGFIVEDADAEWEEFLDVEDLTANPEARVWFSRIKMLVSLKTRIFFDPPTTSILQESIEKQIEQSLWRLSVNREHKDWEAPNPPVVVVVEEPE